MKITSFSPLIVSKEAASIMQLFEDLGFEKSHQQTELLETGLGDVTMKDAAGNRIDVANATVLPRDLTLIRMNVDDFDEAFALLTARGFQQQGQTVETPSSKSAMMVSPSGFGFDLCQHIK